MARRILVRPIITEKAERKKKNSQYCFVVDRAANKLEVKKAVEDMFSVSVLSVNTTVIPGKVKSRNTKTGIVKGQKSAYKKAYVTLAEGEEINFFNEEDQAE